MSLPWFRMYNEFAFDPKVQILAFEDQRHFLMACCLKNGGFLDSQYPSKEYRDRAIAKVMGLDMVACAEANRRLVEAGLIDKDWNPINWSNRQRPSDSSAERTRRYRETSQDRHSDGIEEIRGDKNRGEKAQPPPGLNLPAWNKWVEYRQKRRPAIKPESIEAAMKKLASYGADQMAIVEQSIANGWQGLFDLKDKKKPTHVSPALVPPPKPDTGPKLSPDQIQKNHQRLVETVRPMLSKGSVSR